MSDEQTCDWLFPALAVDDESFGEAHAQRERCGKPAVVLATIGYRRCAEHAQIADGWALVNWAEHRSHITVLSEEESQAMLRREVEAYGLRLAGPGEIVVREDRLREEIEAAVFEGVCAHRELSAATNDADFDAILRDRARVIWDNARLTAAPRSEEAQGG